MNKRSNCKGYHFVISCEHGGNRIPKAYHDFFCTNQALLNSHRGFDPGALLMAKELAKTLAAPLVFSTISRLLVDLNRSVGHPHLHFDSLDNASSLVRQKILTQYYQPYRTLAESLVMQAIKKHKQLIHLSSHSFTPVLNGEERMADIGLLYDPSRPGEVDLCERWKAALKKCAPHLIVRRNYPYKGKGDGLTSYFRQRLLPSEYIGIELEVNHKHVLDGGSHWIVLRRIIIESLCLALKS